MPAGRQATRPWREGGKAGIVEIVVGLSEVLPNHKVSYRSDGALVQSPGVAIHVNLECEA